MTRQIFTADDLGRRMHERRKTSAHNPWLHTTDGFHKLAAAFGLLAFVVIAVVGGFTAATGSAAVQDQINVTQNKLGQLNGHKQVLTSDLTRFNDQISSISGQLAALRDSEARVQAQLDAEQAHLTEVRNQLARERIRYARLKSKLVRTTKRLSVRLLAIFRQDAPDMTTVVLNSDGFSDLLHNVEFINRIGDADGALVREVKNLKAESKRKEQSLASLEKQVQATVDSITAKRNEIDAKRQQVQSRVDQLNAARAARQAALASINRQRQHLDGSLASLRKQQSQVAGQLNSTAGTTVEGNSNIPAAPIKQGSGQFIWPVNGPITSPFCERRAWEACHPGMDIGVASGTPIRAAASGTVASAGVVSGYGNYTCVNHTSSLATCYAHQSSIRVSVGQHVSQGQVIGLSGCTGLCFGPHLHFEVRINGSVTNPMSYLK